jgi:hypothetical protein
MELILGEDEKNRERVIEFLSDIITRSGLTPCNPNYEDGAVYLKEHPNLELSALCGRFINGVYRLRTTFLTNVESGKMNFIYHDVPQAIVGLQDFLVKE